MCIKEDRPDPSCFFLNSASNFFKKEIRAALQPGSWLLPNRQGIMLALAMVVAGTGSGAHRGIFGGYHMNMYLQIYAVSAAAMSKVHLVFGIWNPINDLIGAWVSDSFAAANGGSRIKLALLLTLIWPFFTATAFFPSVVAFLGGGASSLLFFLCTEDTVMSFMAICGGAIWTDCTNNEEDRVKISRVEAVTSSFVGIPFAYWNYAMWTRATENKEDIWRGLAGFGWYILVRVHNKLGFITRNPHPDIAISHNDRRSVLSSCTEGYADGTSKLKTPRQVESHSLPPACTLIAQTVGLRRLLDYFSAGSFPSQVCGGSSRSWNDVVVGSLGLLRVACGDCGVGGKTGEEIKKFNAWTIKNFF